MLDAGEAGLVEPLERAAAGVGDAQALEAAVGGVLAAVQQAAIDERVDGAAGAGQRQAEALGELLDRALLARQRAHGLDLRQREVELLEDLIGPRAAGRHDGAPEAQQLRGELRGGVDGRDGRGSRCLHARKYCTHALVAGSSAGRWLLRWLPTDGDPRAPSVAPERDFNSDRVNWDSGALTHTARAQTWATRRARTGLTDLARSGRERLQPGESKRRRAPRRMSRRILGGGGGSATSRSSGTSSGCYRQ